MTSTKLRGVLAAATVALMAGAAGAAFAQETVLRVAMTAADIPDWTGAPDQGYEGYRFAGYTMYDGLAIWDLSSSDKAADIVPGLATSWEVDPANNLVWTYHLREGVTFMMAARGTPIPPSGTSAASWTPQRRSSTPAMRACRVRAWSTSPVSKRSSI